MNSYDSRYMFLKEEKLKEIINKRKTVVGVASDLNVSRQTIHKWLSRYKRFGPDGLFERRRIGLLSKIRLCLSKKEGSNGIGK